MKHRNGPTGERRLIKQGHFSRLLSPRLLLPERCVMTDDNGLGRCPDTCLSLDDNPHLPPIVDWIGDMPLMHGERDVPYGHPEMEYCLCGHPWYALCPERGTGSVMSMVLGDPYGGRLDDEATAHD